MIETPDGGRRIKPYDPGFVRKMEKAANILGVVKNHPFADGNERVGFEVGVLFLELNSYRFTATQPAAAEAMLALAAGALDESGCVAFLRDNVVAAARVEA